MDKKQPRDPKQVTAQINWVVVILAFGLLGIGVGRATMGVAAFFRGESYIASHSVTTTTSTGWWIFEKTVAATVMVPDRPGDPDFWAAALGSVLMAIGGWVLLTSAIHFPKMSTGEVGFYVPRAKTAQEEADARNLPSVYARNNERIRAPVEEPENA